jgi:FkbM family methyltransferase
MKPAAEWIYDVGMHNGQDTLFYLNRGFRVLAIEANPVLCRENELKFGPAIRKGLLKIINAGISDREGIRDFYVNKKNSIWSSFIYEMAARDPEHRTSAETETVRVPTVLFSRVLEEHGLPYYLKIDIEGHDHHCLGALRPDFKPAYLSMEFNGIRWIEFLKNIGYNRFKIVDQSRFGTIYESGAFGDEAEDMVSWKRWRSFESVCDTVRAIADEKQRRGDPEFWYDIHAASGCEKTQRHVPSLTARRLYWRYRLPAKKKTGKPILFFIGRFLEEKTPALFYFLKKFRRR